MELDAGKCRLRPFSPDDRERLAAIANDRRIWVNLTSRFPHPYTLGDADQWISLCAEEGERTRNFAIEYEGQLVGGIGLDLHDGEKEGVGNVGYWLAPQFWNRGIATQALMALTAYAFEVFPLHRLQASIFAWNPGSARVVEKCGYRLEGRLRDAIVKDGAVTDELWFGLTRADLHQAP